MKTRTIKTNHHPHERRSARLVTVLVWVLVLAIAGFGAFVAYVMMTHT